MTAPRVRGPGRPPLYEVQKARLEAFAKAKANFDETRISEYNAGNGWRIDDYETELPGEAPGFAEPHGAFRAATQVLRNYSFPPPWLISGIFVPDTPLEERVMLLRGRFLFLTFWFGARVVNVIDETRLLPDGRQEQVWGYGYRTLEGHFEKGQIDFSVHKHLSTGRVMFRIHAVSQRDFIRNPLYRLGFRIFGRALQRIFAYASMRRIREQVARMLISGATRPLEENPTQVAVPGANVPEGVVEKVQQQAGEVQQAKDAGTDTPPLPEAEKVTGKPSPGSGTS